MAKKVKIVAIVETEDGAVFDDSTINRSVGLLGTVQSYNIGYDTEEIEVDSLDTKGSVEEKKKPTSPASSETSNYIRDANKIYFGSLTFDERKSIAIAVINTANLDKIENNSELKKKIMTMISNKLELDDSNVESLLNDTNDKSLFEVLKQKFLEGDLIQMFIYIWEKVLSKGEEDDFEVELVETTAEKFGLEKPNITDTKKQGNERAKINKAIEIIDSGKVPYNKLKALEKTVLLALLLTECSTIDGKISPDDLKQLKTVLNEQFNISGNAATVVLEKEMTYSLTKKVEQVEVYREKYELIEFLWERILSTEATIKDDEMELIRKMVRRLDISDVESEGARKDVEQNLNPDGNKSE
tara:strand:- start:1008 stop:2078 length:1071 start_codon:yes stop_codon:yes gene_type:complete